MKNLLYLILTICIFSFSCKKDNSVPQTEEDTIDKLATVLNLHKLAYQVYGDTLEAFGDRIRALDALGQWLVHQAEVEKAYYVGTDLVEVHLVNGLRTDITLTPVDEDGQHLIRGGGSGSLQRLTGSDEEIAIDNPSVLVLVPFVKEFYGGSYNKEALFLGGSVNAPQPSDVTVITGTDVTLADLGRIDSAGFIIFNCHGVTDGIQLLLKDDGFNLADTIRFNKNDIRYFILSKNNLPLDKLANGELRISAHFTSDIISKQIIGIRAVLTVTEEYVRNMNVNLSGSVIFGNHCYSGWVADGNTENNMSQAWLSRGLSSYYGYAYQNGHSAATDNGFCKEMEDSLIANLVRNVDSTGAAHLKKDGSFHFEIKTKLIKRGEVKKKVKLATMVAQEQSPYIEVNTPLYFIQYFEDNYRYTDCNNEVLVDTRDGKVYKTTCIGNKLWMAENLNYAGAGVCYDNKSINCSTYGRLYSWQEAVGTGSSPGVNVQGICPTGWHIPSDAEVQELFDAVGGDQVAGQALKADTIWTESATLNDEYEFSALPSGQWKAEGNIFEWLGERGEYWTSSTIQFSGEDYYRMFYFNDNSPTGRLYGGGNGTDQVYKMPCRCVKN